jgi:hypothetical protein
MKTVWIYVNTDALPATSIISRCSPAKRLLSEATQSRHKARKGFGSLVVLGEV